MLLRMNAYVLNVRFVIEIFLNPFKYTFYVSNNSVPIIFNKPFVDVILINFSMLEFRVQL